MQGQLLNLWRNIEGHLTVVVFVVFGVLLAAVFAVSAMESGEATPQPLGSGNAAAPDISVKDPAAEQILADLYGQKPSIESSSYATLITNSMFDVKAIQNAMVQDQQANRRYEDALRLYNEKKYREALAVCNEVLSIRSAHFPAKQLKDNIEGKLREMGIIRGDSPTPQATPGLPAASPGSIAPATAPTPAIP